MADPELVKLLKQGSGAWNSWRKYQQKDLQIDLSYANLNNANLSYAKLHHVNLNHANLIDAKLYHIDLSYASLLDIKLSYADLRGADLRGADLRGSNLLGSTLIGINLTGANLNHAYLLDTKLYRASLLDTKLSYADLRGADLRSADLCGADLRGAKVCNTLFSDIDLSTVKSLVEIDHQGPSDVTLHTVQLPQDGSAFHFLRGTGVPDELIDLYRVQMMQPIQYHSCFISYSSQDDALARRLHADLQDRGVRCWFAPEDMKIGDKIRSRIDEAIHLQDKLLVLFSEHAINSTWVEDEVETALEKERHQQREVLFPVRLDDAIMYTTQTWAAKLRRTRHIGDFTNWTNLQAYEHAFHTLLRDLKSKDVMRGNMDGK